MWSEAEMRDIEPEPKAARPRDRSANALRRELATRGRELASVVPHQVTRGGVTIHQPSGRTHGNFLEASYRRICAHPAWFRRLEKVHTSRQQASVNARSDTPRESAWRELDSVNSSDALLMNLFCYPRVLAGMQVPALLGIERGLEPVFGFKPRVPLLRGLVDTTEVDLRLGPLLVESKLTEPVFPSAPLRKVERYRDFDEVFERGALLHAGEVPAYQVVRGVLAAHALQGSFCLLYDVRRREMLTAWEQVARAVRSGPLRARLKVLTWQELAAAMPVSVRGWLGSKYGIVAAGAVTSPP